MFKTILNHKPTKAACANIGRSGVIKSDLPLTQNGFVLTGLYEDAPDPKFPYLVVLDFDMKHSNVDRLWTYIRQLPSFSVLTGSHGFHVYYWCDVNIPNMQNKTLTMLSKTFNMKGFDVRGKGGIIFAPGCKFTDHEFPYKIYDDKEIQKIEEKDLNYLIHKFIWEPTAIYNKMRKGFQNIMDGSSSLKHDENKKTGIKEWQYWAAFWREYLNCGGTINDGCRHFETTELQPTFDEVETHTQLATTFQQKLHDKRPSNDFYFRLFPDLEDELKVLKSHTNVDVVITKLMDRVAILEQQMDTVQYYFEGGRKRRPVKKIR